MSKMRQSYAIKGDIVHASAPEKLTCFKDGYIVAEQGRIAGVFGDLPERYSALPLKDYSGMLVMPSPADLHLHAPQFPNTGIGLDYELLPWLQNVTFPEERRYADLDYAKGVYKAFARELVKNGTLRACVFATVHWRSTIALMEALEAAGIQAMVGKVNMDTRAERGLGETTEASYSDTLKWLSECRFEHVKPAITPRFALSCTRELMERLAALSDERGLWVQSHLNENHDEIALVKRLFPESGSYAGVYDDCGLLSLRCIMAHCVHDTPGEVALLKERGVTIAHCPDSNQNISSGIAPIRGYMRQGLKIGLGSDISGGGEISMLRVMACALRVSKLKAYYEPEAAPHLTVPEAFYLGTSGGAAVFGAGPGFAPGDELFALVIDDKRLEAGMPRGIPERLERALYRADDRDIAARYAFGAEI